MQQLSPSADLPSLLTLATQSCGLRTALHNAHLPHQLAQVGQSTFGLPTPPTYSKPAQTWPHHEDSAAQPLTLRLGCG